MEFALCLINFEKTHLKSNNLKKSVNILIFKFRQSEAAKV